VLARASADAFYTRTIHVDGGAVVAWYPNMGDMDIICHVAPGKHEVSVLVKDLNTGQVTQAGPITVFMQPGETQNADFR
jgi:D-alanyl-D-alanine carboxypeptidase